MTPIEQLINEYVEKGNPFFADKLKNVYALELQEQAQARAQANAEILDLEGEIIKLNTNIMKLELALKGKA